MIGNLHPNLKKISKREPKSSPLDRIEKLTSWFYWRRLVEARGVEPPALDFPLFNRCYLICFLIYYSSIYWPYNVYIFHIFQHLLTTTPYILNNSYYNVIPLGNFNVDITHRDPDYNYFHPCRDVHPQELPGLLS